MRMLRRTFFLGIWCLGIGLSLAEEWPIPQPYAEAAIVIDAQSGTVLYEKNADSQRAVASTQKLLTALIIAEAGDLETNVKVERTDTRVEPSKVGIRTGAEYPRSLLVQSLLVKSGNDVARALARDHSGGQDAFRPVMNAKARQLGMGASQFVNAHGLTEEGQYSTARDMAKLAYAAYRNPVIREAVRLKEMEFPMKGWVDTLKNTNDLLHDHAFVSGMKTGFTNAAGRCLVSCAEHDGREVIAVVLGSKRPEIWEDSEALLRWALRLPEEPAPVEPEATESDDPNADDS